MQDLGFVLQNCLSLELFAWVSGESKVSFARPAVALNESSLEPCLVGDDDWDAGVGLGSVCG